MSKEDFIEFIEAVIEEKERMEEREELVEVQVVVEFVDVYLGRGARAEAILIRMYESIDIFSVYFSSCMKLLKARL